MIRLNSHKFLPLALLAGYCVASPALAGIQLITLPTRERVEIQLDHPDVTLIEEERIVPLAAGLNQVVFAWANTSIDRESIQLRPLSETQRVEILSVSYPPGENALTWQVAATEAGSVRMRISYLIGRLDKTFAYRAEASRDETQLTLSQYVLLHNASNEEFGRAGMWPGFGKRFERPIGISETRKLLSARYENVPIRKTYTADLSRTGYLDPAKRQLKVPMHYVLTNDLSHALGRNPLMPGKIRIFQQDGHGGAAFIGEDWAGFTPRDDELKLFLGVARDIVVIRTIEKREAKRKLGNLMDYEIVIKYEIENFKDQDVELEIAESMLALRREILGDTGRAVDWKLDGKNSLNARVVDDRSTADRIVTSVPLPRRDDDQQARKQIYTLHLRINNEW